MSTNQLYHRGVSIALNIQPTVEIMADHFIRLIEQVKPLFMNGGELAKTVQKRWYGAQLLEDKYTYGYIYFTVTNRNILKRDFDLNDPASLVDDLEFSFHVKQTTTNVIANNFVSGSLRYRTSWGDFTPERCNLFMYNGNDMESSLLFRDLITKANSQMAAFSISDETYLGQSELDLIAVRMASSNG